MKKAKKIIAVTAILIVAAVACYVLNYLVNPAWMYTNNITIGSDYVDNSYNNSVANLGSDAVKIGDTILYNYYNSSLLCYGTIAITSENARRVYWEGMALSYSLPPLDTLYNGKVLKEPNTDDYFDIEKGDYVSTCKVYNPSKDIYYNCFVKDNVRYFVSEHNLLYRQEGEQYKQIEDMSFVKHNLSMSDFYLTDRYIFYDDYDDKDNTLLCRYDRKTQKTKSIIFNEGDTMINSSSLLGKDVYLIFLSYDGGTLYRADFKNNRIEKLYHSNGMLIANMYTDMIYFGVQLSRDSGLYAMPLDKPGSVKKLEGGGIFGVYILDNEYVYFQDVDKNLYRVTTDGKKTERVF